MKKIKENIVNLILIFLIVILIIACRKQIFWIMHYAKRVEEFKFIFPFVNNEITNDTFFTIAIGRNIIQNGFSVIDNLTWHSNLEFLHSGVFDLIIYGIYNITQNCTSIYIYTIIMTCILLSIIFYISYKQNKNLIGSIALTLIVWCLGSPTFYARAFQVSFIFFILEMYFIEKLITENKIKYSIIVLILGILIANFHSSTYPIYLVILLPYVIEVILSKFNLKIPKIQVEKRIGEKLFLQTAIIALFTGLCNPVGVAPYTDMFKAMFGISNEFIGELARTTFENNKKFFVILLFTIVFIVKGKQKVRITDILYIAGFSVLTLLVYRGFFFFLFLSGLCITRIVVEFFRENNLKVNKILKYITITLGISLFILSATSHSIRVMNKKLIPEETYPVKLCEYILENINLDNMKIYNGFNYGSYLEYKGIKSFVDSRSGMFCEEFNPGCTVLKDWYAIYNCDENYKKIFEKYGITHAITKENESLNKYLENDSEWILIYEDEYWNLYEKK